jgi:EAL domain-containing protein (putative c-di-GMP-specific phosphodiesterase class I)
LTESLLVDHAEGRVRKVLMELKRVGVTLALDDFGTDYSSLGYLTQLPFDKLKIDRIFINGIADSDRARNLLQGIIALGRGLRMQVVMEGVERIEELEILRSLGCEEVQGYVFARPALAPHAMAFALEFESNAARYSYVKRDVA